MSGSSDYIPESSPPQQHFTGISYSDYHNFGTPRASRTSGDKKTSTTAGNSAELKQNAQNSHNLNVSSKHQSSAVAVMPNMNEDLAEHSNAVRFWYEIIEQVDDLRSSHHIERAKNEVLEKELEALRLELKNMREMMGEIREREKELEEMREEFGRMKEMMGVIGRHLMVGSDMSRK
ncbi:hypothetical protein BDZ97DRAFT_1927770 [Flammula alnicola]|nr:hypothetical protein BDZ97DRAFT_1927770 [Flammula alnicola]